MRNVLPSPLIDRNMVHENLDVAYDAWAPVEPGDGKVSTKEDRQKKNPRDEWLKKLAEIKIDDDYKNFFKTWKQSLDDVYTLTATFTLESRLLLGHGEPSAAEVGLKVHHTWGVPVIPGSALKGLLHHYLTITYDDDHNFKGVTWDGSRITKGPGKAIHALFGGPEATGDGPTDKAAAGFVTFHDALYKPGSAPENQPYAADVLTVHQKSYNDSKGDKPPNDYDSPTPIGFLTVRPKVQFLVALSGPEKFVELAFQKLDDALKEWGIGGKTSAGYGRMNGNVKKMIEKRREEEKRQKAMATPEGRWLLELQDMENEQEVLDIVRENLNPTKGEPDDKRFNDPDERIGFAKAMEELGYIDRWSNGECSVGINKRNLRRNYLKFVKEILESS